MPNVRAALSDPLKVNYDYGYKGDKENKPTSVADDGTKTFFEFTGEVPGIFAVKSDGSETLVNYRREGNYIVVDKVSRQWTLRSGKVATCVFNMVRHDSRKERR
jgi:type IV secretion system protein VirB9